jgi:hypothetical protein
MLIRIAIEKTDPLTGTAAAGRRAPVPFVGWLEMLRTISELVGADGRRSGRGPATSDEPTEQMRGDREP